MYQQWMLVLTLFLYSLISGCQLIQGSQIMRGAEYQGVLFTEGQVDRLYVGETAFWTPTAEDVAALEAGLGAFLQKRADPRLDAQVLPTLPSYNRQYVGIIEDGRRKVYVLFYCDIPLEELQDDILIVLDGGDCYFQLKYDIEDKMFDELMVNGQA